MPSPIKKFESKTDTFASLLGTSWNSPLTPSRIPIFKSVVSLLLFGPTLAMMVHTLMLSFRESGTTACVAPVPLAPRMITDLIQIWDM